MKGKRYKPEEIVNILRQMDVLIAQGQSILEATRHVSITEQTYYRWRQEYGGLKTDQLKKLKDLETENLRLRKAVSDLTLENLPFLCLVIRRSFSPKASKPPCQSGNRPDKKHKPVSVSAI